MARTPPQNRAEVDGTQSCTICHQELPFAVFAPNAWGRYGRASRCRPCYNKPRQTECHGDPQKRSMVEAEYRQRNAEHVRRLKREWAKAHPKETRHPKTERHVIRTKASYLVKKAMKLGALRKATRCNRCGGTQQRIEGHHYDYSEPLAIEWLCTVCHATADREGVLKP